MVTQTKGFYYSRIESTTQIATGNLIKGDFVLIADETHEVMEIKEISKCFILVTFEDAEYNRFERRIKKTTIMKMVEFATPKEVKVVSKELSFEVENNIVIEEMELEKEDSENIYATKEIFVIGGKAEINPLLKEFNTKEELIEANAQHNHYNNLRYGGVYTVNEKGETVRHSNLRLERKCSDHRVKFLPEYTGKAIHGINTSKACYYIKNFGFVPIN